MYDPPDGGHFPKSIWELAICGLTACQAGNSDFIPGYTTITHPHPMNVNSVPHEEHQNTDLFVFDIPSMGTSSPSQGKSENKVLCNIESA